MSTAPSDRIATLDVLRGVAVLGILAMNAPGFALPLPAYTNPTALGAVPPADLVAWTAGFVLFDGKMRALFTILFGAGILLVAQRAERAGRSPAATHLGRVAVLALIGAAHFYFLWWGDILLGYALVGTIAFLFVTQPVERLGALAAILLLIQLLISAEAAASIAGVPATGAGLAQMMPSAISADFALYRSDWGESVMARWERDPWLPFRTLGMTWAETLALMLIGMALLRSGFLSGTWSFAAYRRTALWGLLPGGVATSLCAALILRSGFDPATLYAAGITVTLPLRIAMAVGYAALVILLARGGGWLTTRLAAAGRVALTNYLATSLIMCALFHGWGLGLYGRVGRADLWWFVLAVWLLMLAWSEPWLQRFAFGPMEWLWRSLARGRMQPFLRARSS